MGYSRTFSATHREHLRQAALGRKHTPQTIQKISTAIRKRWAEASPTQATQPTEPTEPTEVGNNKSLTTNKNAKK